MGRVGLSALGPCFWEMKAWRLQSGLCDGPEQVRLTDPWFPFLIKLPGLINDGPSFLELLLPLHGTVPRCFTACHTFP